MNQPGRGNRYTLGVSRWSAIVLALTLLSCTDRSCPYQMVPCYGVRARQLVCADLDQDGTDELLECIGPLAYVKNLDGALIRQFTFDTDDFVAVGVFNLSARSSKDIVFSVRRGDSVFINTIAANGALQRYCAVIGKDINQAGTSGFDGVIDYGCPVDLDGDGLNEVVCRVAAGLDLAPRGVLAYDYHDNREMWHYYIGGTPAPTPVRLDDLDGDGKIDIIFATDAPANGAVAGGIDDSFPHVVVLNAQGVLVWQKTIGRYSSLPQLWTGNLLHDALPELLVCETHGPPDRTDPNRLLIIDPRTAAVRRYALAPDRFSSMRVLDLDRDGQPDIVTSTCEGALRVYNTELDLVKIRDFGVGITIVAAADVNGDGTTEIFIAAQDGRLIVLNEDLEILCCHEHIHGIISGLYLARDGKRVRIVTESDLGREKMYTVYKIVKTPAALATPIRTLLVILLVVAASGFVYSAVARARYIKMVRALVAEAPIGVIVLHQDNKLFYYNYMMRKMIGETKEDLRRLLSVPVIQQWLMRPGPRKSIVMPFESGGTKRDLLIDLQEIANKRLILCLDKTAETVSRDFLSWSGFAQRLTHEIKNPLSTINLTLQRMQELAHEKLGPRAKIFDTYTRSILEEVERLRKTTDRFMRILTVERSIHDLADLNRIVRRITQRYERSLPEEVKIKRSLAPDLPQVRCDENQITAALANIIENSVEAIEKKGTITVKTSLVENIAPLAAGRQPGRFVQVQIKDTGAGIPADQLKHIFEPFYSSKVGGTGLGLVIAKKIVDDHYGTIRADSQVGVGTAVTIELPV